MAALRRSLSLGAIFFCVALGSAAEAGEADVLSVQIECDYMSVCEFAVRVQHADEGWDHYADRWEVLTEDGRVLATRVLRHPHVREQPFERRLSAVELPAELERVRVRAHDSVHDFGGAELSVDIPR